MIILFEDTNKNIKIIKNFQNKNNKKKYMNAIEISEDEFKKYNIKYQKAWYIKDGQLEIDLKKAKQIKKQELRRLRKPFFIESDQLFNEIITKDKDITEIFERKEYLRNITNEVDLCKNIDELESLAIDVLNIDVNKLQPSRKIVRQENDIYTDVYINSKKGIIKTQKTNAVKNSVNYFKVHNKFVLKDSIITATIHNYKGNLGSQIPALIISDQSETIFTINILNCGTSSLEGELDIHFIIQ